jgi:hypothetical protein
MSSDYDITQNPYYQQQSQIRERGMTDSMVPEVGQNYASPGQRMVLRYQDRQSVLSDVENWQGEKIEELDEQLQQAVSRGVLSPDDNRKDFVGRSYR